MFPNRRHRRRHAVTTPSHCSISSWLSPMSIFQSNVGCEPVDGQAGRRDETLVGRWIEADARWTAGRSAGKHSTTSAPYSRRRSIIRFAHQRVRSSCAATNIVARQILHRRVRIGTLGCGANASRGWPGAREVAFICLLALSASRTAHQSRKVWSGNAAQVAGHTVQRAPRLGAVNPAVFAGEEAKADAAKALCEAETRMRWRRRGWRLSCRGTWDRTSARACARS